VTADPELVAFDAIIPRSAQASSCTLRHADDGDEMLMLLVEFIGDDRVYGVLLDRHGVETLIAKLGESLDIWAV